MGSHKRKKQNPDDLSVAGQGSPVSLQKFLDKHGKELRTFTLLVDGTGTGIAKDAPSCMYITPEECITQTRHYVDNLFTGAIPDYLYRYLSFMMLDKEWETKEHFREVTMKTLKATDPDYIHIQNLIKYSKDNSEMTQVLGLCQLIAGTLSMCKKENKFVRLYIDRPETALHPKRQSRFMSFFHHVCEEYGVNLKNES